MMIYLKNISKRYRDHWVFKDVSYSFEASKIYALLGANGSGKSTLLRTIAGMQDCNKGDIKYIVNGKDIESQKIFSEISFCAPAMDVIEEMTLIEFLNFHFSFKKLMQGVTVNLILEILGMESVKDKFIHEFSSGMKQRVKLAQAFFADTKLLFLDEPCSNLDSQGVELYQSWMQQYTSGKLVIIASNDEREYQHAACILKLEDYK